MNPVFLRSALPEVADLSGIEQPPEFHPEGDVFVHTVKALGMMPLKTIFPSGVECASA
ncbi:MAG: hypothetical protein MZV70_77360 [Desulfobacterales bacterium]|nr:hypothetical protein [Desulfobacterales bacterium]